MKFGFQTRILKLQYLQDDLLRSVACGYVNFWTFFSECGSLPGRSRVPGAGLVAHRIPSSWSVTFIAWTWLRCKAQPQFFSYTPQIHKKAVIDVLLFYSASSTNTWKVLLFGLRA